MKQLNIKIQFDDNYKIESTKADIIASLLTHISFIMKSNETQEGKLYITISEEE